MFGTIKNVFESEGALEMDQSGAHTDQSLQVSVLVLLFSLAHQDKAFEDSEFNEIVMHMSALFGLSEATVGELLEVSALLYKDTTKADQFIERINKSFSDRQRQQVLAGVWRVIEADGEIERAELDYVTLLRKRLNLSLEQAAFARTLSEQSRFTTPNPSKGEEYEEEE